MAATQINEAVKNNLFILPCASLTRQRSILARSTIWSLALFDLINWLVEALGYRFYGHIKVFDQKQVPFRARSWKTAQLRESVRVLDIWHLSSSHVQIS